MRRVLIVIIAITYFLVSGACLADEAPPVDEVARKEWRDTLIHSAVLKWQNIFGPVAFERQPLFDCMLYIHPQPFNEFTPIGDKRLAQGASFNHYHMMGLFFKGTLAKVASSANLTCYFLSKEGTYDLDLLLYEGHKSGLRMRIMESNSACLVVVRPQNYLPDKGIEADDIAKILFDGVELEYPTAEKIKEAYGLKGTAKLGSQFSDEHLSVEMAAGLSTWTKCVTVFVGKDGLNIFLFKAFPGRSQIGLSVERNWLKDQLYESDGITCVAKQSPAGDNHPKRLSK